MRVARQRAGSQRLAGLAGAGRDPSGDRALFGIIALGLGLAVVGALSDGGAPSSGGAVNPGTAPYPSTPDPQASIDFCLDTFGWTGTAAGCF
jgi:hypothetical protein